MVFVWTEVCSLATQVHLGYGPTGKNSPPFGCVGSDRTTRDINAKWVLLTFSLATIFAHNVEDVGVEPLTVNITYSRQTFHSCSNCSDPAHNCRRHTHLHYMRKTQQSRSFQEPSRIEETITPGCPLPRRYVSSRSLILPGCAANHFFHLKDSYISCKSPGLDCYYGFPDELGHSSNIIRALFVLNVLHLVFSETAVSRTAYSLPVVLI